MLGTQKTLTKHTTKCLEHASNLAQQKNHRKLHAKELFWGIFYFFQQSPLYSVFCKVFALQPQEEREAVFAKNYISPNVGTHGNASIKSTKHKKNTSPRKIVFDKKISSSLQHIIAQQDQDLDIINLLYIGLQEMSSQSNTLIKWNQKHKKTAIANCKKLAENPLISSTWIVAFLEILHKLIQTSDLDPNQIHLMDIHQIDQLQNFQHLIDSVEKDVLDRNDDKNSSSLIETAKTNKKEDKKLTIEYFGTDLTREAKDNNMDPVIGREHEINQVIYTLLRKNKNNPLLIGEAGVGKTAIVEGLAQKINNNQVPEKLKKKRIFLLDIASLVAGTKYRGEFEGRMKSILEEAIDPTNNIILFIDEIHTLIGAGGQETSDAAQMIKPLLSRGKIKLIGATTFNEHQKYIEKDAALKRRFQEITINEPDNETANQILQGLKQSYEDFHGVSIENESIDYAIQLSKRYILNKHLPDKALDLIDEACAKKSTMSAKLENDESYKKNEEAITKIQKKIEEAIEKQDYFSAAELKEEENKLKNTMQKIRTHKNLPTHLRPTITKEDIGVVLADKVGIPSNIINASEVEKLKQLHTTLSTSIIGQNEAVESIVKTITRSKLSMINKTKPMGSFLFLGPSGVGKTYLAKLIAKEYFGNEKALIRFDMSEFMEKYSVSKLIGSPAGYVGYDEGGNLTEAIRKQPYSVLLFDEIEKASPDVLNILLQILDEGQLKDSKGRRVDFKSTIIIMTSNIGAEEFGKKQQKIGFSMTKASEVTEKNFEDIKSRVLDEVKNFMTPELINRIDYKIVFKHLDKETLTTIFKSKLAIFLAARKTSPDIKLPTFSEKKIKEIIDTIYDPAYGARPIERYIHDTIEPECIKQILGEK